jgi:hypothetical protein
MRSYIFTPREREVIESFFRGDIRRSDDIMRQISVRMKSFTNLRRDIVLYFKLSEQLGESISTISTDKALD